MPATARELDRQRGRARGDRAAARRPRQLPATVVLHGEAGIGKTSIWLAGLEAAAARGYRVLSCRPVRGGGAALVRRAGRPPGWRGRRRPAGAPADPAARTRGSAAARRRRRPQVDERAVGGGLPRRRCGSLAATGRLCLAVDDLQWLDAAVARGAAVRADAPRRRAGRGARSTVRGDVAAVAAAQLLPEPGLRRSRSAGSASARCTSCSARGSAATFSATDAHQALGDLRREPVLRARARRRARSAAGRACPGRPAADPVRSRRSSCASASTGSAARCTRGGSGRRGGRRADDRPRRGGARSRRGRRARRRRSRRASSSWTATRLRFTHPLLGSAVAARQTPARRRALHARLASVAPTREERARHLALATVEPDARDRRAIEAAARSAQARGAPAAAAELAEQALRLTPPATSRRTRDAASSSPRTRHHAAGDTDRAIALLEQARDEAAPGPELAEVLVELAGIQTSRESAGGAVPARRSRRRVGTTPPSRRPSICASPCMMRWGRGLERGA